MKIRISLFRELVCMLSWQHYCKNLNLICRFEIKLIIQILTLSTCSFTNSLTNLNFILEHFTSFHAPKDDEYVTHFRQFLLFLAFCCLCQVFIHFIKVRCLFLVEKCPDCQLLRHQYINTAALTNNTFTEN